MSESSHVDGRRQRKIRKLRWGFHFNWVCAVVFAIVGVLVFVRASGVFMISGWYLLWLSAILAWGAWQRWRDWSVEIIDDPRRRQWALTKSHVAVRLWSYRIAIVALPVISALWLLNNLFIVPIPALLTGSAGFLYLMATAGVGALLVSFGVQDRRELQAPGCSRCGSEFDTSATPIRCPSCGQEMRIQYEQWANSKRSNRLLTLGSVYLLFGTFALLITMSPAARSVFNLRTPTKVIISRLGAHSISFTGGSQSTWTDLLTRMPLSPADQQRLVDRSVSIILNDEPYRVDFFVGLNQWVAEALPKTAKYEESIHALLTHIEQNKHSKSRTVPALRSAATLVYMIEPDRFPASQVDRAIQVGLSLAIDRPGIANLARIQVWLYRAYTKQMLSSDEEARMLADMSREGNFWHMTLYQVHVSTDKERSRLAELWLTALEGPDGWAKSAIVQRVEDAYVDGVMTEEQSQRALHYLRTTKDSLFYPRDASASTIDAKQRLQNMRIAILGNPTTYSKGLHAKAILRDYVHGKLTAEQAERVRAALPGMMKQNGLLAVLGLYSAQREESFTEDDRVRLTDVALAYVRSELEKKHRTWIAWWPWLQDRAASGLLTSEQMTTYQQLMMRRAAP